MDLLGRSWTVWSVVPERPERRRHDAEAQRESDRRRRQHQEFRVPLGERWTNGWLAFETKGEKRRLAPIPDDWELAPEDQLNQLLEQAEQIRPTRRLAE